MNHTKAATERKLLFYAQSQEPTGLCLRGLVGSTKERRWMAQTVHSLRDQGLIFSVETNWRETRWFDSRARADAYLAANPCKRVGREHRKAVHCPAGPAVNTVPIQVCPGIERQHQPVQVTQPVFSAMRPGQYL